MASDELRAKVLEHFPAMAWLLDVPEVADVLQRAVDQEWTPDTFEANLRATQWWRRQTDTQRARVDLEQTDPATAAARVDALKAQMRAMAGTLGGDLTDERAGALAWMAWRNGFSDQQIKSTVAGEVTPSAGATVDVRALAKKYYVDLPDEQAADISRRLFTGELTPDAAENMLRTQAMGRFPQLADYIKQGIRPADYFAPFQQMVASMTGRTADQVDLVNDPTWQPIISHADGTTIRPMTLDEATKHVRSTDAFAQSARGQAEQATYTKTIAAAFGAMGA